MIQIHLFGAQTPTGAALTQQICSAKTPYPYFAYSRFNPLLYPVDLNDPDVFHFAGDLSSSRLLISYAPIWLLAPFLERLAFHYPERLHNLAGVIACSSSSVITKRFATNIFDRELVARLTASEDLLIDTCRHLDLPCRVLRPTLIYGRVGPYVDQNLSRLVAFMRRFPLLPLPSYTGLRQPIHATQLAAVTFMLVRQFIISGWSVHLPQRIGLGGDSTLSYSSMLKALQLSLPHTDPARRCRLMTVPNRLFYAAVSPLLLHSPKAFEAVLRMGADLSGFTPVHEFLKANPQPFPVLPLL